MALCEKQVRSQEGEKKCNNPPKNTGRGQKNKKEKVILSFICLRNGFAVSSLAKTRIKETAKKINDIVTEVLSLSLPMIFELYWGIVIRYFSLAVLVSMLNAYHLVLDDSVTDRGLETEGKLWEGMEGAQIDRKREEAVIQLKSLVTLVSQSLNLHIVM